MMDWQEEKRNILDNANAVVFKVGSAVLTDGKGLRTDVLSSLARQMAAVCIRPDGTKRHLILVTSAAVAAGRAVLHANGVEGQDGLSAKQAAAAIGMGQIMRAWDDAFHEVGMFTAQVLLTRDDFRATQRFLNAKNTFSELLAWGAVPVVNENDTVSTAELKFGDNDTLASLLVTLVNADLYVSITSAPGVFDSDPSANPDARVYPCIEDVFSLNLGNICGGKTTVGTGGMYSKLLAARRVAQRGVPTYILPGREENILTRAFSEEDPLLGTWVRPLQHAIPTRKFWLAYKSIPVGAVDIDAGAADALENHGSSLLPGGIVSVEGNFQRGALIRIMHGGRSLGVGLSNYSAADLRRIKGLKRIEVAVILGDAHYPEVVHRDNLLLDAAI